MKKSKLDNVLNKAIILTLKINPYIKYKGYLVKDEYNQKRYKILPLDVEEQKIVFPASYVKDYIFISNNYLVK